MTEAKPADVKPASHVVAVGVPCANANHSPRALRGRWTCPECDDAKEEADK